MLSINSNPQLKFRSSQTNNNREYNDYTPITENDSADTFELESAETESPIKQNNSRIPKFVRNMILGTALAGGLTAGAPKAEAQQRIPLGTVITKERLVNPKVPRQGKATYYYTQEAVLDSMVRGEGKDRIYEKYDRNLLNSYPVIKYSTIGTSATGPYKYGYSIIPKDNDKFYVKEEVKNLKGTKIANIENKEVVITTPTFPEENYNEDENEYSSYEKYKKPDKQTSYLGSPDEYTEYTSNGNKFTAQKMITDEETGKPIPFKLYFTERPVLDSVIVKKNNKFFSKTVLDRNFDERAVNHINYSDIENNNTDFWIESNGTTIKCTNLDCDGKYFVKTKSMWYEPTPSRKK